MKERIRDRKWLLAVLALFWILAAVIKHGLFSSPLTACLTALFCAASFLAVLFVQGMTERDFLLIACLLGVFFVFIAPFSCIIDEQYHFARAFLLSGGHLFHQTADGTLGFFVPDGFYEYTAKGVWNLANYAELREIWLSPVQNLAFIPYTRSASYLPLDYVFSAAGIALARVLKLPLVFVVLFGRLFNYAAYTAAAYLAIRKAKHYRSLFFLVAVLPSALYSGAVISIDACLIAFCLLYVSVALSYCLEDPPEGITAGDTALLLVSASFILATKYFGYFLILPLILFASGKKLKNYGRTLIGLGAVTLVFAVWQIYMTAAVPGSIDEGAAFEGVSMSGQIGWILANKGTFLRQIGHQVVLEAPQQFYAYSYSEEPLFAALSLPLRFVPFIAAAWAGDKYPTELRKRRLMNGYYLLASLAMMALCYAGLYIAWTPVGASAAEGMQFRYSTPYMIFILLIISSIRTERTVKDLDRTVSFLMILQIVNMLTGTMMRWK